ncbi:MAG: hypothetical protein ACF8PN_08115 [Phycisphaerales bacterium]
MTTLYDRIHASTQVDPAAPSSWWLQGQGRSWPDGAGEDRTNTAYSPLLAPWWQIVWDGPQALGSTGDMTIVEPALSPGFWAGQQRDGLEAATPVNASIGHFELFAIFGSGGSGSDTATVVGRNRDAAGALVATRTYTIDRATGTVISVSGPALGIGPNLFLSFEVTACAASIGGIRVYLACHCSPLTDPQNDLNGQNSGSRPEVVDTLGFQPFETNPTALSNFALSGDATLMIDYGEGPQCNQKNNWAMRFNGTGTASRQVWDPTLPVPAPVTEMQAVTADEQYALNNTSPFDRGWRWTNFIPIDRPWTMECYFIPDSSIQTTPSWYWLGSYRAASSVFRHVYWALEVVSDGSGGYTYRLQRREFNRSADNSQAPPLEFPRLCWDRWNQLIVSYVPNSQVPGSANGNFHYWWNGRKWTVGGLANHGGEEPPSVYQHSVMWGRDPLASYDGVSPAYPFKGLMSQCAWTIGWQPTDQEVADRWAAVCGACRDEASLPEAPCCC